MSRHVVEALGLVLVAAGVRILATLTLGEGAPFGPDGTGAEAAVQLGGHLYPLHIAGIALFGSGRVLSLVTGSLSPVLLWLFGRRVGLGGGGGWVMAFLPLAVLPSAMSGGDAPAIFVVLLGAALATWGRVGAICGGALAMASVAVKPVALPAVALLCVRPFALIGAVLAAPLAAGWLKPIWAPLEQGGLLGTWWLSTGGGPPQSPGAVRYWVQGGFEALIGAPAWAGSWLLLLGVIGAIWPRNGDSPSLITRGAVVAPLCATWAIGAAFGPHLLSPRYLEAGLIAVLPWVGAMLPRGLETLLLWPTAALVTQLAVYRSQADPQVQVPEVPAIEIPAVDARQIFDECSVEDATAMRMRAYELAEELPQGATLTVERLPHGREGELLWPLKVLRPDVRIELK